MTSKWLLCMRSFFCGLGKAPKIEKVPAKNIRWSKATNSTNRREQTSTSLFPNKVFLTMWIPQKMVLNLAPPKKQTSGWLISFDYHLDVFGHFPLIPQPFFTSINRWRLFISLPSCLGRFCWSICFPNRPRPPGHDMREMLGIFLNLK